MKMGGSSNEQTNWILNKFKYKVSEMKQYTIRKWLWEKRRMKSGKEMQSVTVSVLLERKLTKIFLVTYLPTILMNIINQVMVMESLLFINIYNTFINVFRQSIILGLRASTI